MDAFKLMNKKSQILNIKNIKELEINKEYKATDFKFIDTKYGKSIIVTLNNEFKMFLPKRYCDVSQDILDELNNKNSYIKYNGKDPEFIEKK